MAAISANLLAATAPPLNPPVNGSTGTSPPAARSSFAELFADTTATTNPNPLGATLTGLAETADTAEAIDNAEILADGTEGAAVLAAVGLIALQPVPADVLVTPPTTDSTAAVADTAATTLPAVDTTGETSIPTPDASRAEQLRFETAPAARNPTQPILRPTDTPVPQQPTAELPARTTGSQLAPPAAPGTPNTVVPRTPAEAVRAAARTPSVVPQTPLVAELGQLPATPPEVGYGLIGPTVVAAPPVQRVAPVGVGVSQTQVELRATQLPAVEPGPPPTTASAQPFPEVVATTTPQTVAPTPSTVVTTDTPVAASTESPLLGRNHAIETLVPTATVAPQVMTPLDAVPPSTASMEVVDRPAGEGNELSTAVPSPVAQPAESTPAVAPRGVTNAPPPVAAQLSDAFVSHVRVVEKGGTHEFQMRLDPPELGEVKVRVLAMGDRVEAKLVVSDDAVRRLIESQLPELRQKLEAAGVSVPTFDVTTDSGGRANTGGDGWDRPQPAFVVAPKTTNPPPRAVRPAPSGGTLDVTA